MSIDKYENLNREFTMENNKRVKRVAAYCRVSTESEEQASSLINQRQFFEEYISQKPDWMLYKIFADEGKSGTSTAKRKEFNRMIECAMNGEIDLIITKEISRFARNVVDSIQYTKQLKEVGVGVYFLNDGINTLDSDSELRLTIMASLAQDESRRTSERVKWGQRLQMKKGVVFGRKMLGYDVKDGKMTVNKEEAEIVKLIFHKFVNEKKGTHVIARELAEEGIPPMNAKAWSNTVILRAIRNEKYCGDLVQQKTFTPDYLTHKKRYNRGEKEYIIIENHHEPIISKEMFEKAGRILDERSESQNGKAKYSSRYVLSGKIKCGLCGSSYAARYKTRKDGTKYKSWRCGEAAAHGQPHTDNLGNEVGCYANSIRDEDAMHLLYLTFKSLKLNKKRIKTNLIRTIKKCLADIPENFGTVQLIKRLDKETEKRNRLIDLYMDGGVDKKEYTQRKEECDKAIASIKKQIETVRSSNTLQKSQDELTADIEKAVDELLEGTESEDLFYREILNKIVVADKNTIEVYLNFIPDKWVYILSDVIDQSNIEAEKEHENKCDGSVSETDVPISVNSPTPILSGMVNLCDRYRKEALSSPSAPPYSK